MTTSKALRQSSMYEYLAGSRGGEEERQQPDAKRRASASSSPEGSPATLRAPQDLPVIVRPSEVNPWPLIAMTSRVNDYLEDECQKATNESYFQPCSRTQRFFMGALLRFDGSDTGDVAFLFTGGELAVHMRQSGRHYTRVTIAMLDGDRPVESIQAFLSPFGLAAAHHWAVELNDTLDQYLTERWSHTHGVDTRTAVDQFRTYLLWEAAQIRTVPPGGVWYRGASK